MHSSTEGDFEADESQYLLSSSDGEFQSFKPRKRRDFIFRCCCLLCQRLCDKMTFCCFRKKALQPRKIRVGHPCQESFPANVIRNQKYSFFTFIPMVLFEQFKFFLNLFFLVMSLSQFIPELKIGYLYTYWGPLGFVIVITMLREAVDDMRRRKRDQDVNRQTYQRLNQFGELKAVSSSSIVVGDLVVVDKDQRVPADMVFLRTTEGSGTCFLRTDQLDGETDWKLRLAVSATQKLENDADLANLDATVFAEKPQKDIYNFIGTFNRHDTECEESLGVDNTLWANTVVASGTIIGVVVYTGSETRSSMNTCSPRSKVGILDLEINNLTKVLFVAVIALSFVMICLKGFEGPWFRYFFRFLLLFSYIIPISLRVNLDLGKAFYSYTIQKDKEIEGTVVRSTTIPEELGRISYLLTDKTGTLTQNDMVFKMLHLGSISYGVDGTDSFEDVTSLVKLHFSRKGDRAKTTPMKQTIDYRVSEAVKALALCHNVTPVLDTTASMSQESVAYQASSPDEVALVKWTDSVGLSLIHRDLDTLTLKNCEDKLMTYSVLHIFPFTSESKRMGIIVRDEGGEVTLYIKGADTVMSSMVEYNDWLDEECANLAKKGLRTLVVAKKTLTSEQYTNFEQRYNAAKMSVTERASRVAAVVESLECDLQLLCLTGVEDKLQTNVKQTLEMLRNAGMKIWMLTGDKLETATCIAKSSRLVSPTQSLYVIGNIASRQEAHQQLSALSRRTDSALVIKGDALDTFLQYYELELMRLAVQCPAVVVCRCSPTQKASVVKLIQRHTGKRTAAIGDGGNDVSMIQAADAGIGIVGKEGKQASLAADFSITQFLDIGRLFLVHGRYSYKRSAALSQFVMHRGLIISTIQAIFSSIFYFSSVALYQGFLMVGYATFYTNFPVFSLVLDRDVSPKIALSYPELYKELIKGRSLSYKTFFIWVLISIYQGGILMYGAMLLFEDQLIHIVSISFTALVLTELIMVAMTVRTCHPLMVLAHFVSLVLYTLSVIFLDYFDWEFIKSKDFMWKVVVITLISCLPLYFLKCLSRKFTPPTYSKLEELNIFSATSYSTIPRS